jgi:hypothetical protein
MWKRKRPLGSRARPVRPSGSLTHGDGAIPSRSLPRSSATEALSPNDRIRRAEQDLNCLKARRAALDEPQSTGDEGTDSQTAVN